MQERRIIIYNIKPKLSVCMYVCMFSMHNHTTEPIFMKFCMGVLLHPGSVLGYIKFTPFPVGVKWAWVGVVIRV